LMPPNNSGPGADALTQGPGVGARRSCSLLLLTVPLACGVDAPNMASSSLNLGAASIGSMEETGTRCTALADGLCPVVWTCAITLPDAGEPGSPLNRDDAARGTAVEAARGAAGPLGLSLNRADVARGTAVAAARGAATTGRAGLPPVRSAATCEAD